MNQTIRTRIEQINSGIAPEGYQKTDLGIFPCDWEKVSLGDVSSNAGEYGLNAPACEYGDNLPKYLRITDIDEQSRYNFNNAYVDHEDSKNYILKEGDIVFARTGASVGKNYLYNSKDGLLVYAGFLIKFNIKRNFNSYLVCANCRTKSYESWVAKISARSGQAGINAKEFATYPFLLPQSAQEQARIAEILLEWDKAIDLQEQYINKLETRKEALMQKFFNEKKTPNMIFKNLYDKAGEGGTPNTKVAKYYIDGNIPFVKIEHLVDKYIDNVDSKITMEGLEASGAWLIPKNSVIFSNGATIGKVAINKIKVSTKQGILGIIPSNLITLEYLYYLMSSIYFMKKVNNIIAHGTMPTAYLKDIDKLKIYVPKSIVEQQTVASILSQADKEIDLQRQKLDKLIVQRKAMQQYLLTGIVRVF